MPFYFFIPIFFILTLKIKQKKIRIKDMDDYDIITEESDESYEDPVNNIVSFGRFYRDGDIYLGSIRVNAKPLSVMHIKEDPVNPFFLTIDPVKLERVPANAVQIRELSLSYRQKLYELEKKTWSLRKFITSNSAPVAPNFLDSIESLLRRAHYNSLNAQESNLLLFFLNLPFLGFINEPPLKYFTHFYDSIVDVNTNFPKILLKLWRLCLVAPSHEVFYLISDFLIFAASQHILTLWSFKHGYKGQTQLYWIMHYLFEVLLPSNSSRFDREASEFFEVEYKNLYFDRTMDHSNFEDVFFIKTKDDFLKFLNSTNFMLKSVLDYQYKLFEKQDFLVSEKLFEVPLGDADLNSHYSHLYSSFGDVPFVVHRKHSGLGLFKSVIFKINSIVYAKCFIFFKNKYNINFLEENFIYTSFALGSFRNRVEPQHLINRFYHWFRYFYNYELKSLYSWFWKRYSNYFICNGEFFMSKLIANNFYINVLNPDMEDIESWGPLANFKIKSFSKLGEEGDSTDKKRPNTEIVLW